MGEKSERNNNMDVNKKIESEGGGDGGYNNKNNRKGGNTNGAVKWDRLFPKMVLRVLLVEADDSTRQIIAALLKKCCYRVHAVPDGLKAWEMLNGRPHNIDLILTEVDLPAISGYALLTLIMERDICKNIPVIMMSSHNSISTVYKCMMRGASDYLVKPIRKNELRNLWQHVWRKRSSLAGGIAPQDESVGQDKAEATSENNVVEQQSQRIDANIHGEACKNYPVHVSREAIDFMGASTKYISSSSNAQCKFEFAPHLELTLRRSNPVGFEIQDSEERRTLRHSEASAFTRYTNRSPHTPHSTSGSICDEKEVGDKLERRLSCNMGSHLSDKLSTSPRRQRNFISLINAQKESELAESCTQERIFPIQMQVEGVNYNTMDSNYDIDQGMQKHEHRLDAAEEQGQISPATDQSANSSFCNGVTSHINSIGYGSASGSNSNIDQIATANAAAGNNNGEVIFAQNVSSHKSIQREAALTKFRVKRKERCYEKKVRYESRKKLAEQRPRVKGQFVRQVQADPLH